jgi:hypothetical protein
MPKQETPPVYRSTQKWMLYNGEIKPITEWAQVSGVSSKTIRDRLFRYNWKVEDVLKPAHTFNRTHGLSKSPEYKAWRSMRLRCCVPTTRRYTWSRYGGRGIKVCDRWLESFENFYADMGPRPTPSHSLDRIDNDGPYSPENCRWADLKQQSNNKRNNQKFSYKGIEKTIAQWARDFNLSDATLRARLLKFKWPIDEALTTPAEPKRCRGWRNKTRVVQKLEMDNQRLVDRLARLED